MKKLALLFLFALPVMAVLPSCNDDDMPQVNISFSCENGTVVDNQAYVVQPDTFFITSINVTPVRSGHKAMCVGPVNYWIDGHPVGTSFEAPYGIEIPSEALSVGRHTLSVNMGIAEEGYTLATAMTSTSLNVVTDASDIPVPAGGATNEIPVQYSFE